MLRYHRKNAQTLFSLKAWVLLASFAMGINPVYWSGFFSAAAGPAAMVQQDAVSPVHRCMCCQDGGECQCQGDCCANSAQSEKMLCNSPAQPDGLPVQRVVLRIFLKEFLLSQSSARRFALKRKFLLNQTLSASCSWVKVPDPPPPRFAA